VQVKNALVQYASVVMELGRGKEGVSPSEIYFGGGQTFPSPPPKI